MLSCEITCDLQARVNSLAQQFERGHQQVQSLFRRHAPKITDCKSPGGAGLGRGVTVEINSQRNHLNLSARHLQVLRHEIRAEFAHGDKSIHKFDLRSNQLERLAAVRLAQALEK